MVWPLPKKLLADFFKKVKKVIVVEELDPFLETEIKALGYKVFHGKDVIPNMYELSPEIVEKALAGKAYHAPKIRVSPEDLPKRPPNMCPGCSHRALFYSLKKLGAFVFGDIGCYTLGAAPPLQALHSCICMGASIGQAYGAGKAMGKEGLGKICAVIGDSTFLHGGIAPVMDTVYNKGYATSIILDNRTTGMTGLQEHAGTGYTLTGEPANMVDYEKLVRALGVKRVRKVDPYNVKSTMKTIKEEMETDEASVIITKNGPCMLHRREKRKFPYPYYTIDTEACLGCKVCLELGCPAISWVAAAAQRRTARREKEQSLSTGPCAPAAASARRSANSNRSFRERQVREMDNKVTNILLSGVGGQGAILASNILAHVFVEAGYDVKKSEVHGMAQRGGDVTTHFRYGKKVYSPLIKYGEVDFLLAFELLEALRYINHCKDSARIVINDQKILPPAVNLGQAAVPCRHTGDLQEVLQGERLYRQRPGGRPLPRERPGRQRGARRRLLQLLPRDKGRHVDMRPDGPAPEEAPRPEHKGLRGGEEGALCFFLFMRGGRGTRERSWFLWRGRRSP